CALSFRPARIPNPASRLRPLRYPPRHALMRHAGGPVKRRNLILILASTTALSALALSAARARDVPKVATGFVANVVCTETFVSGLDPARVFAETTSAMPGTGLIAWALDYKVDHVRKDVTVTLL